MLLPPPPGISPGTDGPSKAFIPAFAVSFAPATLLLDLRIYTVAHIFRRVDLDEGWRGRSLLILLRRQVEAVILMHSLPTVFINGTCLTSLDAFIVKCYGTFLVILPKTYQIVLVDRMPRTTSEYTSCEISCVASETWLPLAVSPDRVE